MVGYWSGGKDWKIRRQKIVVGILNYSVKNLPCLLDDSYFVYL